MVEFGVALESAATVWVMVLMLGLGAGGRDTGEFFPTETLEITRKVIENLQFNLKR